MGQTRVAVWAAVYCRSVTGSSQVVASPSVHTSS
jgi:hypothetical protein